MLVLPKYRRYNDYSLFDLEQKLQLVCCHSRIHKTYIHTYYIPGIFLQFSYLSIYPILKYRKEDISTESIDT